MDDRILEIKDLLDRANELLAEVVAEQQPEVEDETMKREQYLSKPKEVREKMDLEQVMSRKSEEEENAQ